MSEILAIGIILFFGFFAGKFISKLKFPTVTGYILIGLAFGVSFLKLIPLELNLELTWLIEFALLLVAFNVGMELKISTFKRLGKPLILIIIFETLFTFLFLFIGMFLLHLSLPLSLLIAAIGCATAPAVTVMVLAEYRASGPLTQTLLACVGMDDAIGLMLYSISASIAHIAFDKLKISFGILLLKIIAGIFFSLFTGWLSGILLLFILRKVKDPLNVLVVTIGTIMLFSGLLQTKPWGIRFSPLLCAMMLGFIVSNYSVRRGTVFTVFENFSLPFYVIYFVLAGARLNIHLLMKLGLVALVYLLCRFSGKIFGAFFGAVIGKAPAVLRKYTGFGLFSQAGIAIGLCLYAAKEFPQVGDTIIAIALGTTIVTEFVGPILTKWAIKKAGEVKRIDKTKKEIY